MRCMKLFVRNRETERRSSETIAETGKTRSAPCLYRDEGMVLSEPDRQTLRDGVRIWGLTQTGYCTSDDGTKFHSERSGSWQL